MRLPLALAAALLLACRSVPEPDPRYRPAETVLEVVSVLRQHVPDDTYRFEPARDVSGRNVYRATLLRLENLEQAHADALRAGHMDDVIAFTKGRALERLRAFDLAATSYRRAAEASGPLVDDALRSAALCDALASALAIGKATPPGAADDEAALASFEARVALLAGLETSAAGSHYATLLREETERADMDRAQHFRLARGRSSDGNVRALAEAQRLVVRHRESKLANRHLLALADLYADIASDYVDEHPPESLRFDPPTFQELADSAARLYEAVANQDGTPEKLEAARRLEAFLAFTLRVDRDRFTP